MRERSQMCSSVAIVFSRANNRIALWRVVDILQSPISRECLQELFKLKNIIGKTNKLEKVMMSLTLRMQANSTSSLLIRFCHSRSTIRVVIAMERIRLLRPFKIQSWCEAHLMLDSERMSSNVLIMATRKYWILSGWRSLQLVQLNNGEGMKNGVKVLRKLFGVWIWRKNTVMEFRGHLEPIRQLMDFQPLQDPLVEWII